MTPIPVVLPSDLDLFRISELESKFKIEFGKSAEDGIRAPGRVNLIGEHIDYMDFGVLPMAIDKDIIMIMTYEPSSLFEIDFRNTDSKFKQQLVNNLDINSKELNWINYVKSGLRGLFDEIGSPKGKVCVLVDSTLPSGAGLSSSSALVICSIFFAYKMWSLYSKHFKIEFNAPSVNKLVQLAIKAERFVGVKAGGMDHSISTYGQKNFACFVEFSPQLKANPVKLKFMEKNDPCFVVAHSNVRSDKHITAPIHYNLRVVELRVACHFLGCLTLKEHFNKSGNFDTCRKDLEILNKDGYTMSTLLELFKMTSNDFKANFHPDFDIKCDTFHPYSRAMHVFNEAERVLKAINATTTKEMGQLMRESQFSCKELFDCSCPEINQLCSMSNSEGCRLTGAGWGGCTIHLVLGKDLQTFLDSIRPFYSHSNMDELVFVTTPSMGACYIEFK